jgi:hypothetical protein
MVIDLDENVPIKFDDFIVFVWPGTTPASKEDMEGWFRDEGFNVQFLEAIETNPTPGKEGTGGRIDLFFALDAKDIPRFAPWRFQFQPPMRWLEDVYFNNQGWLYPERVHDYTRIKELADTI